MTRPRLARLARIARQIAGAGRRPPGHQAQGPDPRTSDELTRRLDETRERLRQEIPPRAD